MTSLEQALRSPGELLVCWEVVAADEVLVCALEVDGCRPLARARLDAARCAELRAELEARAIRQGRLCAPGEFVWCSRAQEFSVWSLRTGRVANADRLRLYAGEAVRCELVGEVVSFWDEADWGHRGVLARLPALDRHVVIAEERDRAAQLDPTYGVDHVMCDAAWATFLGRDLAAWLGVPHRDELP